MNLIKGLLLALLLPIISFAEFTDEVYDTASGNPGALSWFAIIIIVAVIFTSIAETFSKK